MVAQPLGSLHLNSTSFFLFTPQKHRSVPNEQTRLRKIWKHSMSSAAAPIIQDNALRINGREALTVVPENVVISPLMTNDGSAFLGAISDVKSCRHVFKLGLLRNCRLLCLFRFKIWWMVPRMGNCGSDVPVETQMLLLEAKEDTAADGGSFAASKESTSYILFLPVLDGHFRSSLQGNSSNELEFCIESGDVAVEASKFLQAVFINYGNNPFDLMKESMKILEQHMGTFSLRENKKMPRILDLFGWCTWDAFYTDVNPQGIEEGLKSLSDGGTPARFLIVDDGWQDIKNKFYKEGVEGSQYGARLVSIKENCKFRKSVTAAPDDETNDLAEFITTLKKTFGVKYVYVWHALMGHWGGVNSDTPGTRKYNSKLQYPIQSPGNLAHARDLSMDAMEKYGVGMIDPSKIFEYYNDQHSYLVSQGVDGVKVDVQNILETLGTGYGGRVSLTRTFQQALEQSVSKHFKDNSIICCMGQNTDSIYSSKVSAITRASDDYMPRNLSSQTLHVAAVAFNSIFLGEVVIPDWDMFYSHHYAAEFHAAARALGGCGVYVSDKPNQHDFTLLKKLVLPDGSVLRAKYPGRPTLDCLFSDPVMDGKSLLKIWNLNTYTGVIGIFNCQGAGIWPYLNSSQNTINSETPLLASQVSPGDIEYLEEVGGKNWTGDCAVYSFNAGFISKLGRNGSLNVFLKVLQCEVFTVSPIKDYYRKIQFAPIGLIKMYNSGGAVESMDFFDDNLNFRLRMKGRGSGSFGAFSSIEPKICTVNSKEEEFKFSSKDNFLTILIPLGIDSWEIEMHFEG